MLFFFFSAYNKARPSACDFSLLGNLVVIIFSSEGFPIALHVFHWPSGWSVHFLVLSVLIIETDDAEGIACGWSWFLLVHSCVFLSLKGSVCSFESLLSSVIM